MYIKSLEKGLAVMPVNARTGAAIITEWERFSTNLPTVEECELWEKRYPIGDIYGIALVCGKASGVEAIDVDTDDPSAHKLIPKSIYGKYGLPGRATYFFKWNPDHYNIGEGSKKVGLYHTGKYHIIPPSRHRKFDGFYTTLGKSILDVDRDELPDLESLDFFSRLPEATSSEFYKSEGRNNFLVRAITAMRADGKPEDEIVSWVYDWDLKNHNPRLFTDPDEQYRAKTEDEALKAAHKMVLSVTRTLLTKNLPVVLPSKKSIELLFDVDTFEPRSYPVPSGGFLRLFSDVANTSSRFDVTPLALGGAISWMSALLSNRIRVNNTWPNTYVLGLGSSGMGKGSVIDLLKDLLSGTNLLGADMYRSSQAFIQMLPKQQQRLDVIDEAAPFFESMRSTSNYTSDLVDVVNRLFSLGPTRYDGVSSAKHGAKSGACYNPCVSIYATVHQEGFLKSVQGYLGSSGLMPRFLVFEQNKIKVSENKLSEDRFVKGVDLLKTFQRQILSMYPIKYDDSVLFDPNSESKKTAPRTMTFSTKARQDIEKYNNDTAQRFMKCHDSPDGPYVSRLYEHSLKLSMISAISMERDFIDVEDVEFAIALVEACFHNSQLIRNSVSNSGRVSGPWAKVESTLRKHGKVSHSHLQKYTDLPKRELDPILDAMIEANVVCVESLKSSNNKMRRSYYICSKPIH